MEPMKDFQGYIRKVFKGINDAKEGLKWMARDLCENQLRFGIKIDEDKAKMLIEKLSLLCIKENEFHILEQVYASSINQFDDKISRDTDFEEKKANIEEYIKELKIRDWVDNTFKARVENEEFDPKTDHYYKILTDLLYDTWNKKANDNDVIQVEQEFRLPVDPISRKESREPVRNIHCGHIYDRKAFEEFMENKNHIQCPVAGCAVDRVTKKDVYVDERLRIMIEIQEEKQK